MTGVGRAWVSAKVICLPSCSAARSASFVPVRCLQRAEPADGEMAVGGAGQRQDRLARQRVAGQRRACRRRRRRGPRRSSPPGRPAAACRSNVTPFVVAPRDVGERAERAQLRGDRGVVAFHHHQLGEVHPRHRVHAVGRASPRPRRLGWPFRRACRAAGAPRRRSLRVPRWVSASSAEPVGEGVEDVEVGAGLPRRWDSRVEGMHERMHVGAGQVVLLVPGRGRQHDVGEQRGGGHPEVQGQQQVELALRRLLAPAHIGRTRLRLGLRRRAASRREPIRWRRKYSSPFALEPSRFERHTVSTRGQFSSASGSSQAKPSRPLRQFRRERSRLAADRSARSRRPGAAGSS